MARVVVGNPFENQIPTVSPTANVVETYVRPAEKSSPFAALAQTLQNIERKATPVLQREEKRRAEKEYSEGVELYNKTRTSIGEAVKNGIIKEGESPYLRKGYRISNLNVLASRYAEELNTALTTKKLYTNGDPAAIEKFTQKFYEDFQAKNGFDAFGSTEVAEYFSTTASKANEAFRSAWKEKHVAWQAARQYDAFSAEVSAYTDTLFLPTDTQEQRQTKVAQLSTWATEKAKQAGIDGMNMKKVNQLIVNSVIMSAYEQNDMGILDVLDNVKTKTGVIGQTLETRKAVFEAKGNIATAISKMDKAASDRLNSRNTEDTNNAYLDGLQAAFAVRAAGGSGEQAEIATEKFSETIAQLTRINTPEASNRITALTNFYDSMIKAGSAEINYTPENYSETLLGAMNQTNTDSVLNLVASAINNEKIEPTQASTIINMWERLKSKNAVPEKIDFYTSETGVPNVLKGFLQTIVKNPLDQIYGGDALVTEQATYQFQDLYLQEIESIKAQNNGTPLTNLQKMETAKRVVSALKDTYVNPVSEQQAQDTLSSVRVEREAAALAEELATKNGGLGGDTATPDF